jgi:hypothetical protein
VVGVDEDGFVAVEVFDLDGAAFDFGEGAVAAVGGVPLGAADGAGAVAAFGAEAAVVVAGVEGVEDAAAEAGGVGGGGVGGGVAGAEGVAGGAGERAFEEGEGGEAFVDAVALLGEFEQAGGEGPGLGFAVFGGRGGESDRALAGVDLGAGGDLAGFGEGDEAVAFGQRVGGEVLTALPRTGAGGAGSLSVVKV